MFARSTLLALAGLAIVAAGTSAFPPSADPQNACVTPGTTLHTNVPMSLVQGTYTYTVPGGTSIAPCGGFPEEMGGSAWPCGAFFVGAVPGAYCGPTLVPGGSTFCNWVPVVNTFQTGLIIGFDEAPYDGFVNVVSPNEMIASGPFTPQPPPVVAGTASLSGGIMVVNTTPVPVHVIAFPTDIGTFGPTPPGAYQGTDENLIGCV